MSVQQIIDVPESGQLHIEIPDALKEYKKIKITMEHVAETKEAKIARLKLATRDKDFLTDLEDVKKDFEFAESNIGE